MKEPLVSVGIVEALQIRFTLNVPYQAKGEIVSGEQVVEYEEGGIRWNGQRYQELMFAPKGENASFSLNEVSIGINFHWERKETQTFSGSLRLLVFDGKVCAINILPVEDYLVSVISSEMSATSSLEFLKAHAVISRSWLVAQMQKRSKLAQQKQKDDFFSFKKTENSLIRWYDREDHTLYDVCADDHCQRYQGITRATSPTVEEAVRSTCGQVLKYNGKICDARFSKCCGGRTELFSTCWEDIDKPYLQSVECGFCNTKSKRILSQILNNYDQETEDFYRWTVSYTQNELSELLATKLKIDFGKVVDLVPEKRGPSGRISMLKIVGTERTLTIGKELFIRRSLSQSHLFSSAFKVEKREEEGVTTFILHGSGWGHGVGLCQIGAAVMGERGYTYDQILLHYYPGASIETV